MRPADYPVFQIPSPLTKRPVLIRLQISGTKTKTCSRKILLKPHLVYAHISKKDTAEALRHNRSLM